MFDFKKGFDAYVASNQKEWAHDRSKTVGASEIFACIRRAYYARHGAPIDADYEDRWGAKVRGDIIENHLFVPGMQSTANAMGARLLFSGEDQQTLFAPDAPLSTTPDGLIDCVDVDALAKYGVPDLTAGVPLPEGAHPYAGHCFIVECKSKDPRVNLHGVEKAIHSGQVNTQIGAIRECTDWKPNFGILIYFDASFPDDLEIYVIQFDPAKYDVAKQRAATVYATNDPSTLMREGTFDDSCETCPYQGACASTIVSSFPPGPKAKKGDVSSPELAERLEPLARAQQDAKFREKTAKREAAEASEAIRLLLREHGMPWGRGDGWSVSNSLQDGRESLDKAAMEADGIDLSKYTKRGDSFEVLRVKHKDVQAVE